MLRNRSAAIRLVTLLVVGLIATTTVVTPVVANGGMTHSAETTHTAYAASGPVQAESDCLDETVDRITRRLERADQRVEFRLDVLLRAGRINQSVHDAGSALLDTAPQTVERIAAQEDIETARDLQVALVEKRQESVDDAFRAGRIDEETHALLSDRLDIALDQLQDAPDRTLACAITDELDAVDTSDSNQAADCLDETVDRYAHRLDRVEFRLDVLLRQDRISERTHAAAVDSLDRSQAHVEEIAAQENVETVRDLQAVLVEQAQNNLDDALEAGAIDRNTHEFVSERLDTVLERLEDAPAKTLACAITDELEDDSTTDVASDEHTETNSETTSSDEPGTDTADSDEPNSTDTSADSETDEQTESAETASESPGVWRSVRAVLRSLI
jgi:hypothetical protein